jgi:hypothetical protein
MQNQPAGVANTAESATVHFEAWEQAAEGWTPPTAAEWSLQAPEHLVAIRMAWWIMGRSKPDLAERLVKLTPEEEDEMLRLLLGSERRLRGLADLLSGAIARTMIADAVNEQRPAQ